MATAKRRVACTAAVGNKRETLKMNTKQLNCVLGFVYPECADLWMQLKRIQSQSNYESASDTQSHSR